MGHPIGIRARVVDQPIFVWCATGYASVFLLAHSQTECRHSATFWGLRPQRHGRQEACRIIRVPHEMCGFFAIDSLCQMELRVSSAGLQFN